MCHYVKPAAEASGLQKDRLWPVSFVSSSRVSGHWRYSWTRWSAVNRRDLTNCSYNLFNWSSVSDLEEHLEPCVIQREMSWLYDRGKCKGDAVHCSFNQLLQQPVHTVTEASGAVIAMLLILDIGLPCCDGQCSINSAIYILDICTE